jgi:glutaredoxin
MRYRVYGFEGCPYCQKAKALLTEIGHDFDYVEIGDLAARTAWMDERGFQKPHRTFPRIYQIIPEREELVGGFDELEVATAFD